MTTSMPHQPQHRDKQFATVVLRNALVEIAVVPELGAKVVSLKNLSTGREWMWSPDSSRRLFASEHGADFASSCLVGWDECLPTIAPCDWRGRRLADHGEAWSAAWDVEERGNAFLTTVLPLQSVPLTFARKISLEGNLIKVDYVLTNRGPETEPYIWAMHPLLAIEPGDCLHIAPPLANEVRDAAWTHTLALDPDGPRCVKQFARAPIQVSHPKAQTLGVGVVNLRTGDALRWQWNGLQVDTLGLWLTRGGWHGHHHLALEPANASNDSLSEAYAAQHCGVLPPSGRHAWQVRLRLEPSTLGGR